MRNLLGPKTFRFAAGIYRSLFVDVEAFAACLAREIPQGGHVLDLGGGDGEPLNSLLRLRPDLRITMIDLAPHVGQFIDDRHRSRVLFMPHTSLADYARNSIDRIDCLLVSDVIHHVTPHQRPAFFETLFQFATERKALVLVKDLEPGHFRSTLGIWCDRYITGDKNVELISRKALEALARRSVPDLTIGETDLYERDSPNYLLRMKCYA